MRLLWLQAVLCASPGPRAKALERKGVGRLLNGKLLAFSVEAQKGAHSWEAGTMAAAGNRDELLASFAAVTGSNDGEMYLQACQLQACTVPHFYSAVQPNSQCLIAVARQIRLCAAAQGLCGILLRANCEQLRCRRRPSSSTRLWSCSLRAVAAPARQRASARQGRSLRRTTRPGRRTWPRVTSSQFLMQGVHASLACCSCDAWYAFQIKKPRLSASLRHPVSLGLPHGSGASALC